MNRTKGQIVKIGNLQIVAILLIISLGPAVAFSGGISEKDRALHFDQNQTPLKSFNFKHDDELRPVPNDFRIVEASFLSNNFGERWAIVTFENSSAGQRFLKNDTIVAAFADGSQANGLNLNETFKGHERLTKAVSFGIHQFPIVSVRVE